MLPFCVFGSLGMGVGCEFPLLSLWLWGQGVCEFSLLWSQGFVEGVGQSQMFSPLSLLRSPHSFVDSS